MEIMTDVQRGEWILERAGKWATVGGVSGTGFEAYARILHPVAARRADLTRTDEWGQHPIVEEATWPWASIAERTGRVMHPLVQWLRLTDDESLMQFSDGWTIEPSRQGWFDPRLFAAMTDHLTAATMTPDNIVAAIWNGWGFESNSTFSVVLTPDTGAGSDKASESDRGWVEPEHQGASASVSSDFLHAVRSGRLLAFPGRDLVLMHGSLTELADPAWGNRAGIGWTFNRSDPTPQMFWPEDHAWVVASEIDWDSTIVAGSQRLVDDVLADPTFEAFELGQDDMLTHDADHINV